MKSTECMCVKCSAEYHRGAWDFHSLCHDCFKAFDDQKMNGRFSNSPGFESVDEWIASLKR